MPCNINFRLALSVKLRTSFSSSRLFSTLPKTENIASPTRITKNAVLPSSFTDNPLQRPVLLLKTNPNKHQNHKHFSFVYPFIHANEVENLAELKNKEEVLLVNMMDSEGQGYGSGIFNGANPDIVVRKLSPNSLERIDADFISSKIFVAAAHRRQLLDLTDPYLPYRLINGEADGLPGVLIDIYPLSPLPSPPTIDERDAIIVIHLTTASAELLKDQVAQALLSTSSWPGQDCARPSKKSLIVWRRDDPYRYSDRLTRERTEISPLLSPGERREASLEERIISTIQQEGTALSLDVSQGSNNYLKSRQAREKFLSLIKKIKEDKKSGKMKALDIFSRFGPYSAALASLGLQVTAMENSSHDFLSLHDNIHYNRLQGQTTLLKGCGHAYLKAVTDQRFDVVVLDPPEIALVSSKKALAERYLLDLNERAIRAAEPGGVLFSVISSRFFSYGEKWDLLMRAGAATGRTITVIDESFASFDCQPLLSTQNKAFVAFTLLVQ